MERVLSAWAGLRPTSSSTASSRRPTPGGASRTASASAMIEAAERDGLIEPGRTTIVEATSGNTGIALALVCAAKGYELVLTLPQGMSRERTALLRQYGARVELVESMGGMSEAVEVARGLARDEGRVPARPVLEPREPGGPPPHDRTGNPRCARWSRRRARRRRGHRGNDHRRRRGSAGAQRGLSHRRGRARGIGGPERRAARARTGSRASAPASSPRCSTASCSTR